MRRDLILSLFGYGATFILGLASSTLAARALGPGGRGELAAMLALPMLLPYLATLGGGQAVIYYSARRPEAVGRYLGTAVAAGLAASIALAMLAAPLQARILASFEEPVRRAGFLFLAFVPVNILFGLPFAAFQGLGRFAEFNLLRMMPQVVYVGVLAWVWSHGERTSARTVMEYLAASAAISVPVAWAVYARRGGWRLSADRGTLRETASYGLYSMLSSLPATANRNIDQMFIAAMLPADKLGWYAVAATWGSLLSPVVSAIGSVVFPRLAGNGDSHARAHFSVVLRRSTFLIVTATTLLIVLAPVVIPTLFGVSFAPAVAPCRVLALAGAFLAFNIVLSDGLRGLGRPSVVAVAETAALAVTLGGIVPALRFGGILGAAWLSLASYATGSVILAGLAFRYEKWDNKMSIHG